MANYKYEIVTPEGKARSGTLEASNEETAQMLLRSEGNLIVSLSVASALEKDIDIHIGKVVKPRELSIFCRQFQSVLNAGVTVIEALEMLGEQTENKQFKAAIEGVRDSVQRGQTLADAMAAYPKIFPAIMIHMIAAGEASGGLDVAFDRMGTFFEKEAHLKGMIVKSMIYPIILIIVIIAVVIILMVKIVPTFTDTFDEVGAELPGITLAVMGISDALIHNWYWMLGGLVIAAIVLREFKKTEWGAVFFGKLGLKMPLFGNLTIKSAAAQFARTLSTLTASGIKLVDALTIVEKIMSNEMVKRTLREAEKQVMEGISLSIPLAESGVFPPMVHHMVKIGEETGNMEEMLDKIAEYYDEEVEMATQALLAALEPLIIILMALVVVPIILAVMMPMYSLYDAIG